MNAEAPRPRGRGRGGGRGLGPGRYARATSENGTLDPAGPGGGRYRRSVLEASVLALLAESRSHGYELVEQIDGLAADLVCIDPGSMYRMLRGLEQQGLVSSTWETAEAGPSRRVYAITAQGQEALALMANALSLRAKSMKRLADYASRAAARSDEETAAD